MKRTILCWLCSAVPLFAETSWPYVDYKEVRAYAWAPQKSWNYPYTGFLRADFWMISTGAAVAGAPLPEIQYSEQDAYIWTLTIPQSFPRQWLIRPDMSFASGVINKDGALLSAKQVSRLLKAESRRFQRRGVAGCYNPHNAFVFYDAEKKPVAFLEICFDCLGSRTVPEDEHSDPNFYALAVLCAELKLPFGRHRNPKQVQDDFDFAVNPAKVTPSHRRRGPVPGVPGLDVGR